LTTIFEIKYSASLNIEDAINKLIPENVFEYVEPRYTAHIDYSPNDPSKTNSGQYFLTKIQAYGAWDITKGDTNVVIGIVDSGTDWDHPDLAANIKYNYKDPIDGLDNDGDGHVDNFHGWDISDND